ncbi:MAG TPA: DUF3772 domain-containing protein, partial [Oligella sp.]|nr:DUF3772 domain-containing protein [Oligella sp.]
MPTPFLVFLLTILLSVFSPLTSMAQSANEAEPITIEKLQLQLKEIPVTSKDNNDLQLLTTKLSEIQQNAEILLSQVTKEVVELEQKLNSISKPATAPKGDPAATQPDEKTPEKAAKSSDGPETLFIAEQRDALQKEHTRLDAQRKHLILI